ncbi:hypothetical protein C7M84_006956 [Penaeus vannamei]|uniref:Uncharacterized protein n=1 Tax=Penaeus vannamei TaxID=6689 RepID=A0A3R7M6S1_PENVA|nr:hypothetical protein C7M84_006956 [Penaeus vannamei]
MRLKEEDMRRRNLVESASSLAVPSLSWFTSFTNLILSPHITLSLLLRRSPLTLCTNPLCIPSLFLPAGSSFPPALLPPPHSDPFSFFPAPSHPSPRPVHRPSLQQPFFRPASPQQSPHTSTVHSVLISSLSSPPVHNPVANRRVLLLCFRAALLSVPLSLPLSASQSHPSPSSPPLLLFSLSPSPFFSLFLSLIGTLTSYRGISRPPLSHLSLTPLAPLSLPLRPTFFSLSNLTHVPRLMHSGASSSPLALPPYRPFLLLTLFSLSSPSPAFKPSPDTIPAHPPPRPWAFRPLPLSLSLSLPLYPLSPPRPVPCIPPLSLSLSPPILLPPSPLPQHRRAFRPLSLSLLLGSLQLLQCSAAAPLSSLSIPHKSCPIRHRQRDATLHILSSHPVAASRSLFLEASLDRIVQDSLQSAHSPLLASLPRSGYSLNDHATHHLSAPPRLSTSLSYPLSQKALDTADHLAPPPAAEKSYTQHSSASPHSSPRDPLSLATRSSWSQLHRSITPIPSSFVPPLYSICLSSPWSVLLTILDARPLDAHPHPYFLLRKSEDLFFSRHSDLSTLTTLTPHTLASLIHLCLQHIQRYTPPVGPSLASYPKARCLPLFAQNAPPLSKHLSSLTQFSVAVISCLFLVRLLSEAEFVRDCLIKDWLVFCPSRGRGSLQFRVRRCHQATITRMVGHRSQHRVALAPRFSFA